MTASYRVIGLMSGSSLDGLDIACCDFTLVNGQWQFTIPYATCAPYTPAWADRLRQAHKADGKTLWQLHADFGHFCGRAVHEFIAKHNIQNIDLIGSHGHTVFHFPQDHFTTQIGDGAALAVAANLPVACDFRSTDVAKGGQGAPLVPIGDKLLFGQYKFLLNLGGIANITMKDNDKTIAFDICSANQVLNFYAQQENLEYDAEGALAAKGKLDQELFNDLNLLNYYKLPYPKSLDNGYSRDMILPIIEKTDLSLADKMHTFCEHIAFQIGEHIKTVSHSKDDLLLASGGGVFNKHLMQRIAHYAPVTIKQPDANLVNYKEALVFAFIGLLRLRGETNILSSVTGATEDSVGGALYLP